MITFILKLLLKLIIGHCLADYPLQGDFLAKAKNFAEPITGVPWYQAMIAHSVIQGGMVWYMTGSLILGTSEFCAHFLIDSMKCARLIGYNTDQFLHVACKVIYVLILATGRFLT